MPARDSNEATWYIVRYPEDFSSLPGAAADASAPFAIPSSPYLEPALLFDERRGVLELRPGASPVAAEPPSGIAVDIDGEIYRVDDDGRLIIVRCDGSVAKLVCEPGVLAQPAGLALDRRGFLHVADPAAARVVVLRPEDGRAEAILGGGGPIGALTEPVDVAVSPAGFVYVADRAGGRIAVFSARMRPLAAFATAAAEGRDPAPVAVMIDKAGNLLVADAWLPRLQCYAPDTTRRGDVEIATLLAPLSGGAVALGAFERAYGDRVPRFLVGDCGPCATSEADGGARLAEVHRALRLLSLMLGRRFERRGAFYSRALDGGRPGVAWHRVEVELAGEPPPGCRVTVETATSDSAAPALSVWTAPRDRNGVPVPFTPAVPEQLVQSPRGRYLWLRVTLDSVDGAATPGVRAIRAFYPRLSWLDLLPAVYRRDPEAASFTDRFLALFEHVFTGVEDRYVEFSRELNPDAAPREVIDWLAALVDLAFDPSWPVERRRALVAEAMALYRGRGTVAGIERYVEIYTGIRPVIVEGWLERPGRPTFLGRPGAVLGCGLPLLGGAPVPLPPDDVLWARFAHRFTVFVYVTDPCDAEVTLRAADRIIEVNKPAHAAHRAEAVFPQARVGVQSRVGLDLMLGAGETPRARLADGSGGSDARPGAGAAAGGVLGRDTVLGPRRPGYVRPLDTGPL